MSDHPLEIMLVEDDAATAIAIQQALSQLHHPVTYASTGQVALDSVKRRKPELAIISTRLPGQPDCEALSRQMGEAEIPILLLSSDLRDAKSLLHLKPVGGLVKPLRDGEIEMILSVAQNMLTERLELKQKSLMLNGIVDGMLDSVFIVDKKRKIVFANATAARLTHCQDLDGRELKDFFVPSDNGNEELEASVNTALNSGSASIGSGAQATLRTRVAGEQFPVVVIVSSVRDSTGGITGASLSFRKGAAHASLPVQDDNGEPGAGSSSAQDAGQENGTGVGAGDDDGADTPLRAKAIRSIELRLAAENCQQKHYAVVLLLSQFDMFRLRYGLNSAEKLVHAFTAHLIKSLPPEDRLYNWSNRTVVVLLERDSGIDEVRLEMTAFCSRRVDYYLAATGRSALVTLSASWTLIPLFDCPEAKKDPRRIVDQIDAFERLHTKRK
jgi:PAS domain S-box-containing protein